MRLQKKGLEIGMSRHLHYCDMNVWCARWDGLQARCGYDHLHASLTQALPL